MRASKKVSIEKPLYLLSSALIVLALCAVGLRLLSTTHAATPFVSAEAESGHIVVPAVKAADTTASGGSAIKFAAPAPARTIRYMPLGDSVTDGYGLPGSYRTVLWQKLVSQDKDNIDFVGTLSNGPTTLGDKNHEGHSGWCIDGTCTSGGTVMSQIDAWLTASNPDIVSIHLGTNDLNQGASGATTASRLDALVAKIYQKNPNCYVVLVKIIYMRWAVPTHDDYVNAIPGIASKYLGQGRKISVADLSTLLTYPDEYRDSLHPTQEGFDKMGNALYPVISAAYKSF